MMNFLGNFITPAGMWNPLIWVFVSLIIFLIAYLIWSRGESRYKKGTEQTLPFLSGYAPESAEGTHVRAGNIYWGFVTALKGYYKVLRKIHTGNVNDYVGWYVGILAIMLLIYLLWGGA